MDVARGECSSSLARHLLPFPTDFQLSIVTSKELRCSSSAKRLKQIMTDLRIPLRVHRAGDDDDDDDDDDNEEHWMALGAATENVWSRASRRRRQQQQQQQQEGEGPKSEVESAHHEEKEEDDDDGKEPMMIFEFLLNRKKTGSRKEDVELNLTIRWLKGDDAVLFESFCGMIKREINMPMM